MKPDEKLVQALDDLLVVYDFLLRGERAEGDQARLEATLGPKVRAMSPQDREDLYAVFSERAREEGWDHDGVSEFLEWLEEELGL